MNPEDVQFRAVLWDLNLNQTIELPPFGTDGSGSATAISDRGHVVGISGDCDQSVGRKTARHAVLWENGTVRDLGNLGADTGIATEMPPDKYGFTPTEGAFRGVRSFAAQIKHVAALNHLVAATLLDERITADMSDERGPDSVQTKADVRAYLAASFAALRRAAVTVNSANAFQPIKGPFTSRPTTRFELIVTAVAHTSNHYGQVVEYLRMNGLVPPRTQ